MTRQGAKHGLHQFHLRCRCRRHCARHLEHARPLDERHRREGDGGARGDRRKGRERCRHQGRGRHLRQGHVLRRRRPHHAGKSESHLRRADKDAGPGGGECAAVRGGPQALADLPPHRDLRQALGRGAQRNGDGRRLRARARLPPPHRFRQRQDAARPAGNQGRPVPRRRRHATRRAHAAAGRRPAVSAQGRPAPRQPRQGDEAHRRSGAAGRSGVGGQGLDQERRQRQGAVGCRRLQTAGRARLFESRAYVLAGRQRALPPRNLRQLSRRARGHPGGL